MCPKSILRVDSVQVFSTLCSFFCLFVLHWLAQHERGFELDLSVRSLRVSWGRLQPLATLQGMNNYTQ